MSIDALPNPPSRGDSPDDFSSKADAFLSALPLFVSQLNATAASLIATQAPFGSRITGLIGQTNAVSPTYKLDLSATTIIFRDANRQMISAFNVGILTCNIQAPGPVINGRDQSAEFNTGTWINFFFIWNGATVATIASTNDVDTGPNLPSGYTHWCYATTVYLGSTPSVFKYGSTGFLIRGNRVNLKGDYNAAITGDVSAGVQVDLTGLVPPNALRMELGFRIKNTSSTSAFSAWLDYSAPQNFASGIATMNIGPMPSTGTVTWNEMDIVIPNINGTLYVRTSSTLCVPIMLVRGYTVVNGDS